MEDSIRIKIESLDSNGQHPPVKITDANTGKLIDGVTEVHYQAVLGEIPTVFLTIINPVVDIVTPEDPVVEETTDLNHTWRTYKPKEKKEKEVIKEGK